MPFGIQIAGPRLEDRRTLRIAEALEAHFATVPGLRRPLPGLASLTV